MTTPRAGRRGSDRLALVGALASLLLLSACGRLEPTDGPPHNASSFVVPPDAVPKVEPRSRYGNPRSYVVNGRRYHVLSSGAGYVQRGIASWYGRKFHGRRTSSGETYDMGQMTAAHRSLPLPSYAEVTNLETGKRIVVRINDRGPFHANRIIDLSYVAARKLGILAKGTGFVEVRAIDPRAPRPMTVAATSGPPTPAPGLNPETPRRLQLFLQAGAFSRRENAHRLKTRLMSVDGSPVGVSEAIVDGQAFYRVRLGPFAEVADADRLSERLIAAGFDVPTIVIE